MSTKTQTTRSRLIRRGSLTANLSILLKVQHLGGMICYKLPTIAGRQCGFKAAPAHKRYLMPVSIVLVAYKRIIRGRPYSILTFPLSSIGQYSSLLGIRSAVASGIRSMPPVGDPDTPQYGIRLAIELRQNTVIWPVRAILVPAMTLMLRCTLFDNQLPNAVTLTSQLYIL